MLVCRDFKFDAAHFLPSYKGKCERLHGHTYRLRIAIEGEPDAEGMIVDFGDIKKIVTAKVLDKLDHHNINDVIPNPSAENISMWIWQQLEGEFGDAKLHEVTVWETDGCFVVYSGESRVASLK